MPKWLKGMVAPTLMLWLFFIAWGIASCVHPDGRIPMRAKSISRVALPLILAFWVTSDAQKRRSPLCFDYGSFVFFASPIFVPIYLFQTRGWRAFLTLLCFLGICLIASVPVVVVTMLQ